MKKLSRREKVLVGVSVISVGVAGYFGYKYINTDKAKKDLEATLELANQAKDNLKEEIDFIKFLVIESECVPKAKQNGENKLARKETKMKELLEMMIKSPNKSDLKIAYEKHTREADVMMCQLDKIYKLEELMANDENIYAK